MTGTSNLTTELSGKQLELLLELAPSARRIGYLTDPLNKGSMTAFNQLEQHARAMNVTVRLLDGRQRSALEQSLDTVKRERLQGLIVGSTGVLLAHREEIVGFAAREKVPVVYARREYVDAGGLASYSADLELAHARAAEMTYRILKGALPADLPVEQSSKVRAVLNLKTARALGIKIPASVRGRVDEVIDSLRRDRSRRGSGRARFRRRRACAPAAR